MFTSLNLDLATQNLKKIVDCNRCRICDKLEGPRLRFACGHTACADCVAENSDCSLCLNTYTRSSPTNYTTDNVLTQRTQNVSEFLNSFQTTFSMDLYKRLRLSEQLKKEKELFPECIQAPAKYTNKKISTPSRKSKENTSRFLGEHTSPGRNIKMEHTSIVQQWLDKKDNNFSDSPIRKPLGNLSVNSPRKTINLKNPIKKRADLILEKVQTNNTDKTPLRKRSHFKTFNQAVCSTHKNTNQEIKQPLCIEEVLPAKRIKNICEDLNKHDENAILITDSEPIVIEDSQSEIIDKDRQAWLAVLEAEKNERKINLSSSIQIECNEVANCTDISNTQAIKSKQQNIKQVPFLKKGCLIETCQQCDNNSSKTKQPEPFKDVAITIDNNSFTTTIRVSRTDTSIIGSGTTEKHSVSVQTDLNNVLSDEKDPDIHRSESRHSNNIFIEEVPETSYVSQDLFTNEAKTLLQKTMENKTTAMEHKVQTKITESSVVISDSDSDDNINNSYTIEVKADVHKSRDQIDVLAELDPRELQPRRGARAATPSSTNSSEKENYDPNKIKRRSKRKKKPKYP